ncbi:MAG: sigma-70 family RNA polymerase sigma factor [Bacteroidetes bacterium]|nr:sigma-70 family RNA polymerase sigma factor [Bacteroidota bacterium]
MIRISEEEIIHAFKKNDHSFIRNLYAIHLPVILRYVTHNNGEADDAKDLIQQAMLIVFQKVRNNEFELTCSFKTYLYSICKNLWLKELRKKKIENTTSLEPEEMEEGEVIVEVEKEYDYSVQYFLYRWHFHNLSSICKDLLKMTLAKVSYDEIAERLNFTDGEMARKKKYRCKELLIKRIKGDPRFNDFEDDEKED